MACTGAEHNRNNSSSSSSSRPVVALAVHTHLPQAGSQRCLQCTRTYATGGVSAAVLMYYLAAILLFSLRDCDRAGVVADGCGRREGGRSQACHHDVGALCQAQAQVGVVGVSAVCAGWQLALGGCGRRSQEQQQNNGLESGHCVCCVVRQTKARCVSVWRKYGQRVSILFSSSESAASLGRSTLLARPRVG
jgi:hypothetical protein